MAAILKIITSPYLNEISSNFDEIWYASAYFELDVSDVHKYEFLKFNMADGRHIEKSFFGHNSASDCPILVKFCTGKQNSVSTEAT